MLTKNLTTKEMYASIPETQVIVEFFKKGLEINNDRLAVSAMEELILRGDTDYIAYALNEAFEKGWVREGSTMISMIGRSLKDGCREADGVLCRYGDGLTKGDFCGPFDWIVQHATDWGEDPRAGLLRKAKKWVREIIFPSNKSPFGEGRCYPH